MKQKEPAQLDDNLPLIKTEDFKKALGLLVEVKASKIKKKRAETNCLVSAPIYIILKKIRRENVSRC